MKQFAAFCITLILFTFASQTMAAQAPCTVIYGGGTQEDGSPYCLESVATTASPLSEMIQPTPAQSQNNNQTKGGMQVQNPPTMTTSPSTGPEMLSLLALIPAAAAGVMLRRKTQ